MKLPAGHKLSAVVSRDKEAPVSMTGAKLWREGERAWLSVTDGHMGLVVDVHEQDIDAEDLAGLIPIEALEAAEEGVLKLDDADGRPVVTAGATDVIVHLEQPHRTLIAERPSDLAPDVRGAIERVRQGAVVARVALDTERLRKLAKGLGTKNVMLILRDTEGKVAVEVALRDPDKAKRHMAALMPLKPVDE